MNTVINVRFTQRLDKHATVSQEGLRSVEIAYD